MSEIERGIPIPPNEKVPLDREFPELLVLEVGDSFVIPEKRFPGEVAIAMWGIKHGQRHEMREVEGGFRVWRKR